MDTKAYKKYLEARELLSRKHYNEALVIVTKAIFISKKSIYYLLKAKIYTEMLDFESAMANAVRAVDLDSDNVDALVTLAALHGICGQLAFEKLDYNGAVFHFSECLDRNPTRSNYFLSRALAYCKLEKYEEASRDMAKCVGLDKDNADAYVFKARLNWKLGRTEEGNADIKKAGMIDPSHPDVIEFEKSVWLKILQVYQEAQKKLLLKDYDGAITLLTNAVNLNPGDQKCRMMRASCYRQKGDFELALEDVEEAAKRHRMRLKDKKDSEEEEEDDEEGVKNKEKALSFKRRGDNAMLEPVDISRQRNLIYNDMAINEYTTRGNFRKAVTLLNKVIESETEIAYTTDSPMDIRFLLNRGDCYKALGKFNRAISDYRKALEYAHDDPDVKMKLALVHNLVGIQLFNEGRYAESEVEFGTAISFNNRMPSAHIARGDAAYQLQRFDVSFKCYVDALKVDPKNKIALAKLDQFEKPSEGLPSLTKKTSKKRKSLRVNKSNSRKSLPKRPEAAQLNVEVLNHWRPELRNNLWETMSTPSLMVKSTSTSSFKAPSPSPTSSIKGGK